jgi:7-cyano-7-deazaguanine synthase
MDKRAVILLSGGLDSTTTLAIEQNLGFHSYALTFSYGQRHGYELIAASRIARRYGVAQHLVIDFNLRLIGGSSLLGDGEAVPEGRSLSDIGSGIPSTYVPARNTIFLSFAVSWAEVLGANDIFIGVNAIDYSGYPDCRPEFIEQFQRVANLGTRAGVGGERLLIHTPLISLSKADIIRKGLELGVDYGDTSSCYAPSERGEACGRCDSCILRLRGFAELNAVDPVIYNRDTTD